MSQTKPWDSRWTKGLNILIAVLAAAASGSVATKCSAELPDSVIKTAEESLTYDELQQHAAHLASDSYEGREAGSRGGRAAGGYIVKELQALDLQPAGENGYFQAWGNQYRNILALLEGSDPQLKNELIVIGAHYDHVGYGSAANSYGPLGYIHNGADDNASGTSAVLELAEAFAEMESRPKRSILFVWWDAEEKGLMGSKHWLANRTLSDYRVAMNLNMDMVGRMQDKQLEVSGVRTAAGLRELVARHATDVDLTVIFDWEIREDSDHWPFFSASVPFLMLHTGLHDNYHRPSDDADLLNIEGMRKTTRLMLRIAADVADRDERFGFRRMSRRENEGTRRQELSPPESIPTRLGITWDPNNEANGLTVTSVIDGSVADQAGIRRGDRLIAFNEARIPDGDMFRAWIMAAEPTTEFTFVSTNGQETTERVELGGYPVRLGISWKEDDAEPGCLKLSRVIAHSPAAAAGLQQADRVLAVNGKRFASGEEFRALLAAAGDRFTIEGERNGKISEVEVIVPEIPVLPDQR